MPDPMEALVIPIWDGGGGDPLYRGGHVHSCPQCFEDVPCEDECHCADDLRLPNGTPRGHHVVCDECIAREARLDAKVRASKRRFIPFFRWYDLWVGAYWDRRERVLYVCPLPMVGFQIRFGRHDAAS